MLHRYEVCYDGGMKYVVAGSPEAALAKFKEEWEQFGDVAPVAWIGAAWSTTN